jgi:hypothetical protein
MTYPDDDLNNNDDGQQRPESHDIQQLRAKAKRADTVTAENEQLKRELALTKSGVDLSTPLGKLFEKAYDGQPTAEAVKASAIEYGVLAPPPPVVDAQEAADLRMVAQVGTSNAATSGAPSNVITPEDAAGWGLDKGMRFAKTHPTEWEALKRGEDVLRP